MTLTHRIFRGIFFTGLGISALFAGETDSPIIPEATSFIGVCSQITRETKSYNPFSIRGELLDAISTANMNITRTGFRWKEIHPGKTEWNWKNADAVVASARAKNIRLLALLSGIPRNARSSPEQNISLWLEFVNAITTRYSEDIVYWEIWNEPNMRTGKYWPQDALPDQFAVYVIEAGKIIRQNQPNATVLLGGVVTGKKSKPFEFWESVFSRGVLEVVDGIAYHTYPYSGVALIDFNKRLANLVAKYTSQEKEYWITEYGVPAVDIAKIKKFNYDTQAKNLMKSVLIHWATGGDRFFIYALVDKKKFSPAYNKKELKANKKGYYGLLKQDRSPKQSYSAIKWLSSQLTKYEPIKLQHSSDGVIIIARNKKNGKKVFFSWGSKVQNELINNRTKNKLSVFETSAARINLDQANSRTINKYNNDVLFWH